MSPEVIAGLMLRGIGALCGAALALMVRPAQSRAEFVTRLAGSIMAGILFATPLRERIAWPPTEEYVIASATVAALVAWWAMAAVVKIVEKWEGPPKK